VQTLAQRDGERRRGEERRGDAEKGRRGERMFRRTVLLRGAFRRVDVAGEVVG